MFQWGGRKLFLEKGLVDLYINDKPERSTVGQLKLLSQIPYDCKVYVFYIPGIKDQNQDLPKTLADWGDTAGKNVFVGLVTKDAPDYATIAIDFNISNTPAIVVSATPEFATDDTPKNVKTIYARIDNDKILSDTKESIKCIQKTYNLFIEKQVRQAISNARKDSWKKSIEYYLGRLKDLTGHVLSEFLKDEQISIDVFKGTFTISPSKSTSTSSSTNSSTKK
jgi:hypothetical protein